MNIGEAAKVSGVSAKMIRYYEQIKLIIPASRSESNYRVYSESEVDTLRFTRRARDLGFSVQQIKSLLALWRDNSRASADVKTLVMEHVSVLEQKAAEITEMTDILKQLAKHCYGNARPDCPIIEGFARTLDAQRSSFKAKFGFSSFVYESPAFSRKAA